MKTVGRYEILRDLGRGGMAIVYLARQTDLDRFVALKELGAFHASDPQVVQRFLRESRMAGSLSHPNIVVVYDYFEDAGTPYIAMEYIERGSLRPHVGRLTLNQIAGVLEGLLAGLAHAEQQGIVHRDLKPENVMITADGRVKIADFGIAKATNRMQTGAFLTATGTTVGTPTYMAPEQAMAQEIGPWTDLYSVGVMAFELFVGRTPFHDSEAPMAILLRHVNEQIPAVKSLVPDVDQEISDWIERLVVKEPAKRMRSAQEAWDDLEEIVIGRLGPRWRRGARLVERARQVDTPKPLTPAPFHGTGADEAIPDDFDSLPVGPDTPIPAETPTAPPGPATPPPEAAAPEVVETPSPETGEESGFVTFGPGASAAPPADTPAPAAPPEAAAPPAAAPEGAAPPAPPPEEAAPPVAPPEGAAPPAAPPEGVSPPAAPPEDAPPEDAARPADQSRFQTYIPPPLPGHDAEAPPATEAPPEEAAPAPPPVTPVPEPSAAEPAVSEPRAAEPVAAAQPSEPALAETAMPASVRTPPPTPRAPAPAAVKRRRFALLVAGVAVVAAIAGFMIATSGSPDSNNQNELTVPAANQNLALQFPSGWSRVDPPSIPGVDTAGAAALAPGGRDGETAVVFGQVDDAGNPALLSSGLLEALGGPPKDRAAVKLTREGLEAYRYTGLRPRGFDRRVTLYAVPNSGGVATVACLAPAAAAAGFGDDCENIANTLKLSSVTAYSVGPSEEYGKTVGRTLADLDNRVQSGIGAFRKAPGPKSQADAARSLATAYGQAAETIAKLETSPADRGLTRSLAAALGQTGRAYRDIGSAAADGDRQGDRRARASLRRGEQALTSAVNQLKAAGYKLGG